MHYTKTITIQSMREIDGLQIGQWFKLGKFGHPAQWMGKASNGKDVIRSGKFSTANAVRNKLQRQYTKSLGAK